jgi:hypothetical protein
MQENRVATPGAFEKRSVPRVSCPDQVDVGAGGREEGGVTLAMLTDGSHAD